MLEELSSMDRITQLQDEIQNASLSHSDNTYPPSEIHTLTECVCRQLLTIMSRSIAYLTSRVNFVQISDEIPVTKQRNPEKVDPPDVFEGQFLSAFSLTHTHGTPNSKQEGACGRPHDEG
jgi:mediator of RNA polymerase II transcription subunit 21